MAYYTKIDVSKFIREIIERAAKSEIQLKIDPEEAANKLGADEDMVAMFWLEYNPVEGSENLKVGLSGKVFVRIDFDLYSDDRYAIDCYQACKEGTTVSAIVRKRNEETKNARAQMSDEELERIKNAINMSNIFTKNPE